MVSQIEQVLIAELPLPQLPLSPRDCLFHYLFQRSSYAGVLNRAQRYGAEGLSDAALRQWVGFELGIWGGCTLDPTRYSLVHRGGQNPSIVVSEGWNDANPLIRYFGSSLFASVRRVFDIPHPDQPTLF